MSERPLAGKRIAITRSAHQSTGLMERLRELGAEPISSPSIAIAPLEDYTAFDTTLRHLTDYDWIVLTSVNGVEALFERMDVLGIPTSALSGKEIGAIGPATAHALAERGIAVTFTPSAYVAESILAEIGDVIGKHILLPRADIAREMLAKGLREQGAFVDEVAAYRTIPNADLVDFAHQLREGRIDAILFTSSSTVRYLLAGLQDAGMPHHEACAAFDTILIACIGPITAATARDEGLIVTVEASTFTTEGLVDALTAYYAKV
jgi:uroporphyrinogen-III synthase